MRTQIAVGVIYNKTRDKVLLARRPDDKFQGGLWEFPGGKILPGENSIQALERELFEELNLRIESTSPLITIDHDYPGFPVTLNVFSISSWHGHATGSEGQHIEWMPIDNLNDEDFPKANAPIITAVRLPHLYLITPDLVTYDEKFLQDLDKVLQAGIRLLQFRCKRTPFQETKNIISKILKICNKYSCMLLINGEPDEVEQISCHGLHVTSDRLLRLRNRPLSKGRLVAASCHNSRELDHACNIGADYAVLSPVKNTRSHTSGNSMGWNVFSQLARRATIPVYALGGMKTDDMRTARENGGQGIAMISGIWGKEDKVLAVKRILAETV